MGKALTVPSKMTIVVADTRIEVNLGVVPLAASSSETSLEDGAFNTDVLSGVVESHDERELVGKLS